MRVDEHRLAGAGDGERLFQDGADIRVLLDDQPASAVPFSDLVVVRAGEDDAHVAADLTVLFIDHDIELALRLATAVTVLHLGAVVAEGTPDEIRASHVLDDIYLGTHA